MGVDALDRTRVEMWQRRMEMNLLRYVANTFRHAHPAMATWEVPQIKEFSETNRPKAQETLRWLNDELANKPFIAGERYTIADITAMIAVDFMKLARIDMPRGLDNLQKWYENVKARP